MTQKKSDSKGSAHADSGEELRRRAEKKAKADEASIRDTLSPEESRQTLYELRVHQIELEMQNEELRRAQEALEALRARYFDLYDLAPVGYFVLSEQGLILEANLTSATMLGEERGALVKKPIARFIFPEDQDIYYRHRKPLFETGAPQVCELRMARKDGALFWARVEATAAQGTDGGLVCRAAISDITERKRAEEALREAEQQFHTLADAGQALIWTSGPDKKCNYFNLPWLRFTGRTLEQEMNDGWTKGVHPDDFERCLGIYTEAFEQRECFSMDYRLCHRDGQFRWIQDDGTPRYDSQGNFLGYLGHCLDITDRKRAEAAVQASESRYRQLVENAKEAILVAQDGFLKFVNRMASEMTGYSEPELISRPFPEFIHPDDREMVVNQYLKRMAGDTDQPRYVFRLLTRDGAVKWVELGAVLIDWEGRPATLNFLTDITDRRKGEEVIQASLQEKEVMLREIHHRVKNNMQVISSLFNLQAGNTHNRECRKILKEAQTRIRAMSLAHEKLYHSRDLSKIDLASYIQSLAIHLFNVYVIDPDRIRLETDFGEVSLDINSAVPCGLILNELISNSLKHAFPEGRKGLIRIGMKRGPDSMIVLRVADDGIGFPKNLDFHQAESFGLQIVTLLVGQLDGTIELDRKKGAAFTIVFREQEIKARAEPAPKPSI